jgi:2-dehydropantoate 2-reductase
MAVRNCSPTVSLHATSDCEIETGRPVDPVAADALERLATVLRASGIGVHIFDDVGSAVWRKLIVNCSVNPVTALLTCTHEELLVHPTGTRLVDALATETARVARAIGVDISAEFATAHWREVVTRFSSNPRSSMLQDVLLNRETEIDALSGAVSALAEGLGVAVPLNRAVTELIRPLHPQTPPSGWPFSPPPRSAISNAATGAEEALTPGGRYPDVDTAGAGSQAPCHRRF